MSSRPDNIAAESPAPSPHASADSSTTCELTDAEWVQGKYTNFRAFVRSLVPQEPKVEEWSIWLDKLPLSVFLAGGDGELKGVREASTDAKRSTEAGLVLERFALDWDFDLSLISDEAQDKLRRYILLFASC